MRRRITFRSMRKVKEDVTRNVAADARLWCTTRLPAWLVQPAGPGPAAWPGPGLAAGESECVQRMFPDVWLPGRVAKE
jgi:hypothetical protein